MQEHIYDVVVIGGGAAGLMAAVSSGMKGKRVLVLEKNKRLGEKLRITGGGRCNVTNAEYDIHTLLTHYGKSAQFLYGTFAQFGIHDTFDFFEKNGLPLIVEARKRAFPKTEKASDVCSLFERLLKKCTVEVLTHAPVSRIVTQNGHIEAVEAGGVCYKAASYIVATGGVSHPETGSTGDGFTWLKELGHTVKDPTPGIVPLKVADVWVKKMAGVTLKGVKITFFVQNKKQFHKTGDILCTHFGLSGPMILGSAHMVADMLHEGEVTATIDLFPKVDEGELDRTVVALFEGHKNKTVRNALREILTPGSVEGVLTCIGKTIDPLGKVHSLSKESRKILVRTMKAMSLSVTGLMGFDKAVVADGGVSLSLIDMRTMRSKKIDNLFIVGDLLDINRPSGGYSLQLCWTTGYVAGTHA